MKNSKLEKNEKSLNNEESKIGDRIREKMALEEKNPKIIEGKLTSGYFMRNARYKPGVNPIKMQEK